MKFSKRTNDILKNYASINNGITFYEGSVLRTNDAEKTIISCAVITEKLPRDFSIYNLGEFLNTASLLDDPEFHFEEDYIKITSQQGSAKYVYSNPLLIRAVKQSDPKDLGTQIQFTLTKSTLDRITKASAVMRLPEILIDTNGAKLLDTNSPDGNEFEVVLENLQVLEEPNKKFLLAVDALKIIADDYVVQLNDRLATLTSSTKDLRYFIPLQAV